MYLDKIFFDAINGYKLPHFWDSFFSYLHGIKRFKIAFFLFCLILFLIVMLSPKKGPRTATAVFIASMITFFGAGTLRKLIIRSYPFIDFEPAELNLRVEILIQSSAFPVISNLMIGTIVMAVVFYFPKSTKILLTLSLIYSVVPIYLGIAYPIDAIGSFVMGLFLGYVQMSVLSIMYYFQRRR